MPYARDYVVGFDWRLSCVWGRAVSFIPPKTRLGLIVDRCPTCIAAGQPPMPSSSDKRDEMQQIAGAAQHLSLDNGLGLAYRFTERTRVKDPTRVSL